jgi:hypothetical protein
MNVEFTTEDARKAAILVAYFQQDVGEVAFFNDDDLGFVRTDASSHMPGRATPATSQRQTKNRWKP